ncbi:MAG: hypothetical protein E4H09_01240 [Spirochaetales bacterium]|nr:MAG: hypothetical protein E4H09_01240 [Spirochaetales bacterium]
MEIVYRTDPGLFSPAVDAEGPSESTSGVISFGDLLLDVDLRPGTNRVVLYPEVDGVGGERLVITSASPGLAILGIAPKPSQAESALTPVPVDLGTLLRYPTGLWRNVQFELFSWSLYPDVLILDSDTYLTQSRFFKRAAFFIEKRGFRGTLLSDSQLAGRHGYNAHNYSADGLAAFFTSAMAAGVELTDEELVLRRLLIENMIIAAGSEGYVAVSGGILGISQESAGVPGMRELLLGHEAYHGVYYAEPGYAAEVNESWDRLPEDFRRYWELLLSGMQYDTTDPYLVRNEYHAYLLQQPVRSAIWYFEVRSAERVQRWFPGSAEWVRRFLADNPGAYREQAAAMEERLRRITGLRAGDVWCLEPIQ